MNTELLLSDKRFRWISTMYYYVAADAEHTTNVFKNLVDFLEMKVGDLGWGPDNASRDSSKSKFCSELIETMQMRGYHVPEQEVRNCLSNDQMSNKSMAAWLAGFVK